MAHSIFQIALVVRDYDEAIAYFTRTLDFALLQDDRLSASKRWVCVAPKGSACSLLLAQAATDEQRASIGNQTGGRVFLFMHTDDIERDYRLWSSRGVLFDGAIRVEPYGKVTVFTDLYGNKWDLIQPKP